MNDSSLPTQLNEWLDEAAYQQMVSEMVKTAQQLGATQAEVDAQASIGLSVSVRKQEIETLEFNRDKTVSITVYIDQKKGSASTTDLSKNSLRATVQAAIELAQLTESDPCAGLAEPQEMAKTIKPLDLYHPWQLGVKEAIEIAKRCEQIGFEVSNKIINSEGAMVSSGQSYHIYHNSHGFLGYYPTSRHSLSCTLIAQDGKGMERDYEYTVARSALQLEGAEIIGWKAAEKALSRLNAKKLSTRKTPVLFEASVAGSLLNHLIAALSGGRLFRKTSFLLDSLHQKIFPPSIHIYERPHLLGTLGSAAFDNDGIMTQDKDIVLNGVVQSYLLSAYSARKLKLANTGNAGGVHNLFIQPTHSDFNDLLKLMDRGLLVTELMGPGVNLVTGDYSKGIAGFWIENGKIQYPVDEMTIAGNLRTMFAQLIGVGNDVDMRSSIKSGSLLIEEMILAGV